MGNNHSGSSSESPQRRALVRQLTKHSPIRLCFLCQHGKCKRIVDMAISKEHGGEHSFRLGNIEKSGHFVKSHFVTTKTEWAGNTLIIRGCTPNGSATLEIKTVGGQFLGGSVKYEAFETGASKTLDLHVHLHSSTYGACIEKFGGRIGMKTRPYRSMEIPATKNKQRIKRESEFKSKHHSL